MNSRTAKRAHKLSKAGFSTRSVHAGWSHDPATGASSLPIYATAAYQFDDSAHAAALFALEAEGFLYTRLANPTVMAFSDLVASLEGGAGAVATSSGQAALTHVVAALCSAGDHIVMGKKLYGGSVTLIRNVFGRFGVECTSVDTDHPCAVEQAVRDETRLILTETIGNPGLNVAPFEALAKVAKRAGVPLVVDNTFASPALCRPLEWGADIVLHSATKYLSGQGNVIGGVIVDGGRFDWSAEPEKWPLLALPDASYHGITFAEKFSAAPLAAKIQISILRDLGSCLSPFDAYLLRLGATTLPLRMRQHSENALAVARYLEAHDQVEWVRYPGLASHPQNDLAAVYLPQGCGGMVVFSIKGGLEAGRSFLNALSVVGHMANVGDVRTLAVHPASTTHAQLDASERLACGIDDGLIRLSIGIEDAADIVGDLEDAFAAVRE